MPDGACSVLIMIDVHVRIRSHITNVIEVAEIERSGF